MTTRSSDIARDFELGTINEFPVIASDIIYEGSAVGDNASGYARPLVAGDAFLGFAESQADNSAAGSAAGDINVRVRDEGLVKLTISSIAITDVGKPVYASDDDTFTLTPGVNSCIGYVYRYVTTNTCIVKFRANGGAFAPVGTFTHAIDFANVLSTTNTDGSLISTGAAWIDHATAGSCAAKLLCASSATSGDYATLRMRARSDGVNPTGGVVCINGSASGGVNDYANLYAVQGYAQPNAYTQSVAANIICGVYSCIDRTGTSVGRSWSLWTDTHETVKATGGHYLHRLSHNGGAINLDGIWTIYPGQGCDTLFNFENANAPIASGDATGGTKTYKIAVTINGTAGYLQWYAA